MQRRGYQRQLPPLAATLLHNNGGIASNPHSAYALRQSGFAALAISSASVGFFGSYSGSGITLNTPREPSFSLAISRARRFVASRSMRGNVPGRAPGSAGNSTLSRGEIGPG